MSEFEVTCVNKPDRMSAHEHITHIGNTAGNWRMTREEAIRRIDSKQEALSMIDCIMVPGSVNTAWSAVNGTTRILMMSWESEAASSPTEARGS